MLKISKSLGSSQVKTYYEKEYLAKESYWQQEQTASAPPPAPVEPPEPVAVNDQDADEIDPDSEADEATPSAVEENEVVAF